MSKKSDKELAKKYLKWFLPLYCYHLALYMIMLMGLIIIAPFGIGIVILQKYISAFAEILSQKTVQDKGRTFIILHPLQHKKWLKSIIKMV